MSLTLLPPHTHTQPLFKKYNQSKKALRMGGWEFDDDEYWTFMRAGAADYLKSDEGLQSLLAALPQKKVRVCRVLVSISSTVFHALLCSL